ncbi:polysaccharide biosynthesis tyrosine autokinase [Auraticoccus monumenti]|uniref:non-specific protein-tyrosine kinase n=1 Tax=Auraticoccus monumenti TaxID=675864 RepID=A0A1G6RFZ6_9ACTN|nr:polysaccharide biosynthesis tyrosine autokinase [Auraticoccus monumenti]SDD03284.1 capsular exopolysaccharide family [Auraticoccus monumenti]
MELSDYLAVARKRWPSILACALAGVVLAALASLLTTPLYTARTSVFFAVSGAGTSAELAQGSTYAEKQVQSYAELAESPIVLQPVIERLQLPLTTLQLVEQIEVTVPPETVILTIQVSDPDPIRAAEVTNVLAEELTNAVQRVTPRSPDGEEPVRATVIASAVVPIAPSSPDVRRNTVLGLLLGAVVGVGVAVLRTLLDTRVRDEVDVAKVTDHSVMGVVGLDAEAQAHPLVVHTDPHSPRAEAYRRLRTNLQFLDLAGRPSSIVITSSIPGEGKSTTSINLATTMAETGQTVLLIDADLRRPQVAKYLQLEGAVGLTTVLIGRADLIDVVQPLGDGNLHVLPSGQIPPNPSELLGSDRMRRLLVEAAERYDIVLLDSPPLLPVTDSAILSRITGGALLVVGSTDVHRGQLETSLESLKSVDARILGLVLNKAQRRHADRYSYDYTHKHGYAPLQEGDAVDAASGRHARSLPGDDVVATSLEHSSHRDAVR